MGDWTVMTGRTAKALWQDYRVLTKEMLKFLDRQDMALFYNILNQREQIQFIIEQTEDDGFKDSPEGRRLLEEIQSENELITNNLQFWLNSSKRHRQVSQIYNKVGAISFSRVDWKR